MHLWLLNTHYLMKRAVPLRPQEIIHFCKFRPPQKRAWNYPHLARKIHQGGTPLQPRQGTSPASWTFWQPLGLLASLAVASAPPPCWKSPNMLHILKGWQLHAFSPLAIVYCYLEFKLRYLKNLKLFSIRVKELSEPIVLWRKGDGF